MSAHTKKSIGATVALILLGLLAIVAGEKSLVLMIPAAGLVWYAASPRFGRSRN